MTTEINRRELILLGSGALFSHSTIGHARTSIALQKRAIGVNCFNLFYGPLLNDSNARLAVTGIRELKMAGIPFVRFAASPFWPIEWNLYKSNPSKYFGILDSVISAAEDNDVGLIPSLFWNPPSVSDFVGEPLNYWGIPNTKTTDFMIRYVNEVVFRYKSSKSIFMWEFGNEFNTYADMNNSLDWFPKINTAKGTPSSRGINDKITSKTCRSSYKIFAEEVRKLDLKTPISTGSDIPRANAFNLSKGRYTSDTPYEFRSILLETTPSPANVVSMHMYRQSLRTFSDQKEKSYTSIISEFVNAAHGVSKNTFIGEFGIQKLADKEQEVNEFKIMLESIVKSEVNWAAVWVYDLFQQRDEWSIQNHGDRSYQLELIAAANRYLINSAL